MAFFFFFIVFLINQILLFAEDILSKGADVASVLKLLFYSLPIILAITVPFSVLAATLMTSSRQNADNEFLASSTLGVRPTWLYMPFIIVGVMLSAGSFFLNDWSIPRASEGYKRVYADLIRKSAKIELAPYSITRYGDVLLVTGSSDSGALSDIVIINQKDDSDSSVSSAKNVKLNFSEDAYAAILSMSDLTEEKTKQQGTLGDFSITSAKSATIRIQIKEQIPNFSGVAPSEMSLHSLSRQIHEKEGRLNARILENKTQSVSALDRLRMGYDTLVTRKESSDVVSALNSVDSLHNQKIVDSSLQVYRLEYQKKFVIPSACFFFAFLAFPLGIGSKRAGRTAGFGIALLLSVIYWALLFAGQTLGYRQDFSPFFSMWMPNLIMLIATFMLWIWRKLSTGHFL